MKHAEIPNFTFGMGQEAQREWAAMYRETREVRFLREMDWTETQMATYQDRVAGIAHRLDQVLARG